MALSHHLVVNFKLLNHPEFQKHPERRGDHGIVVQGKVVKVKLVNAQLTAQGDFSCLKERGQLCQSLEALRSEQRNQGLTCAVSLNASYVTSASVTFSLSTSTLEQVAW